MQYLRRLRMGRQGFLQAVTVNKTESASLTVIAHSVDGGNLSYQKYARRTASP